MCGYILWVSRQRMRCGFLLSFPFLSLSAITLLIVSICLSSAAMEKTMFEMAQPGMATPAIYLQPAASTGRGPGGRGHVRQRSSVARVEFSPHGSPAAKGRESQELQMAVPLLEAEEDGGKEHSEAFPPARARKTTGNALLLLSWTLSLVLASACTYAFTRPRNGSSGMGSFATGFATDLGELHTSHVDAQSATA